MLLECNILVKHHNDVNRVFQQEAGTGELLIQAERLCNKSCDPVIPLLSNLRTTLRFRETAFPRGAFSHNITLPKKYLRNGYIYPNAGCCKPNSQKMPQHFVLIKMQQKYKYISNRGLLNQSR